MGLLLAIAANVALACGCNGGPAPFEGAGSGPEPFGHEQVVLAYDAADAAGMVTMLSMRLGLALPPRDVEGLASARLSLHAEVPAGSLRPVLDAALACHRFRVSTEDGAPRLMVTEVGAFRTHDTCAVQSLPMPGTAEAAATALAASASPRGSVFAAGPDVLVLAEPADLLPPLIARAQALDASFTEAGAGASASTPPR